MDDTSSFGPEIVTVLRPRVGTYRYFVDNFSGPLSGITLSPTRVELTVNGSTQPFSPPPGETSLTRDWTVFDLVVAADCSATVLFPQTPWTTNQPERPAPADDTIAFCDAGD